MLTRISPGPAPFSAFVAGAFVACADSFEELLAEVRACWSQDCGEDVALWHSFRLVAVHRADGSLLRLDGREPSSPRQTGRPGEGDPAR